MVVGFNHNFRYKGEVFHVQTEDGGLKNPQIVTLLYRGGTILSSKKTSYSDIDKVSNLDQVVEELMKEQHKDMLRRLKNGEFDGKIEASLAKKPVADAKAAPPGAAPEVAAPAAQPAAARPQAARPPGGPAQASSPAKAPPQTRQKPQEKVPELSLDDIILSYLVGEDRK